jgi:hypothetical protein
MGEATTLKVFLKPKLIWVKSFLKKHPLLFKAAKFFIRFFPERITKRLRGLQTHPIASALSHLITISHLPPVDKIRAKHIYDQLNVACENVRPKRGN